MYVCMYACMYRCTDTSDPRQIGTGAEMSTRRLGHFGTTNTFYDEKSDYVNFMTFR